MRVKKAKKKRITGWRRLNAVCLLALSLLGFGFGLQSTARARQADALRVQTMHFRYEGLGREAFPRLMASLLRQGTYGPFTRASQPEFPIPALGQGYVPQGMCYAETLDAFLITSYYPEGERPCVLSVIDAPTGNYVKSVYLLKPGGMIYNGHAGGVAAWGKHIWVTSESRAYRLTADDLRGASDESTVRFRDFFRPGTRGAFSFCADDMLWVGEYYSPTLSQNMPANRYEPLTGNNAWCAGFALDTRAPQGVKGLRGGETPAPTYLLSLPNYCQGACGNGQLYLSTSFSSIKPSWLLVFPPLKEILARQADQTIPFGKTNVPLYILDATAAQRRLLPPMSEGIAWYNNKIYALFESAARPYRDHTELFADYVFSLSA
ncbi:MAG: hypothetical protein LBG83_08035 [Oscillospiraceae bacterium]|jgi:hypothetical protein|nr:hypothetical protein [Oscillospiraceae bacterium]